MTEETTEEIKKERSELDEIIEKAREDARSARENNDKATTAAVESEASRERALSAADTAASHASQANTLLDKIKNSANETSATLTQITTNRKELLELVDKARTNAAEITEIARTADEKDARVKEYEKELQTLRTEYDALKEKIENLLPGATSTGLAKAFNARKKSFHSRLRWSFVVFLVSIAGFIAFGLWAILLGDIKSIQNFLIFAIERSPIIVGLILLEEFSRRLYYNTLRLEEDYAFKETISTAFEGYREAMTKIDSTTPESLTKTLSANVLDILNAQPGRLYDVEKGSKISTDLLISALKPEEGESKERLALRIYDDLKHHFRGATIKIALILIIAIAVGVGIGYYVLP